MQMKVVVVASWSLFSSSPGRNSTLTHSTLGGLNQIARIDRRHGILPIFLRVIKARLEGAAHNKRMTLR